MIWIIKNMKDVTAKHRNPQMNLNQQNTVLRKKTKNILTC